MRYTIEEKPSFQVIGIKETLSVDHEEQIPLMWQKFIGSPEHQHLLTFAIDQSKSVFGLCADPHDGGFDYWISVITSSPTASDSFSTMTIPAVTWAVFEVTGAMPQAIKIVWKKIFSEWLPTSGYTHANAPEVEFYPECDGQSPDYRCEIWIPVMKIS